MNKLTKYILTACAVTLSFSCYGMDEKKPFTFPSDDEEIIKFLFSGDKLSEHEKTLSLMELSKSQKKRKVVVDGFGNCLGGSVARLIAASKFLRARVAELEQSLQEETLAKNDALKRIVALQKERDELFAMILGKGDQWVHDLDAEIKFAEELTKKKTNS